MDPTRKVNLRLLRKHGAIWLVAAPVITVMAAISTVQSNVTYWIQLAAFSVVALAGSVAGVGALFQKVWAARCMVVLSWACVTYFLGLGISLLFWAVHLPPAEFHPVLLLAAPVIASPAVPSFLMARSLRRLARALSAG